MARRPLLQVKEVAQRTGVSVRTLHHYDELGLLVPRQRSRKGYRLYGEEDLLRLQQILIGRELGLPLEAIRRSLDEPSFDRRSALRSQREELAKRAQQTEAMLRAIDAALALLDEPASSKGDEMDLEKIFDGFEPSRYEAEAEQRWGDTEAFRESKRRTARYTAEDWQRLADEQKAIYAEAFEALQSGIAPDSSDAMNIAERHRLSIERWFYPCDRAMHRRLADMYEQDSRFADNIDKYGVGLTPFLAAAMRANAERDA